MVKFILFIKRVYVLLLFIILEAVMLNYYSNSTSYTKAKLLAVSNHIVGGVYGSMSQITTYFSLRRTNDGLSQEIVRLRNELEQIKMAQAPFASDSMPSAVPEVAKYRWSTAHVINNSITHQQNFISLDRGTHDGIENNMAVVTAQGELVGNVLKCSDKFAVCVSVLNTGFRASGRIKGSDWFGPIFWDGKSHQYVTLTDIPKYATLTQGDSVVTTDYSAIFPPNLMIGTVESYKMNKSMLYDVKVKLAAQLSSLGQVFLIKYNDGQERIALEAEVAAGATN